MTVVSDIERSGDVERAREAAARGDWQEARDLLVAADAAGGLRLDDLAMLGEVAYAAGDLDLAIETWERAYAVGVESEDPVAAAGAASRVAMHLLFDTALLAPVRGWLARAQDLLEGHADTSAHAWHALVRAYERLLSGEPGEARPWAQRAVEVGASCDPAAHTLGRVVSARLLILDGDFREGLAMLDEVGVAAVSGDLDPLSVGVVYCELVCALQGVGQYDAAEEWTEAMERWCRTNAIGSLHGRCRVHRAEILRLRGELGAAEREVLAACDELRPYLRRELGWPLSELGQIRFQRGDVEGAEAALLGASEVGWDPQPTLARVQLERGEVATADESLRGALEHTTSVPSKERPPNSGLQRAPLLEAEVELAVTIGDLERAEAAAYELEAISDRFPSRALKASAALANGRVRLARGDTSGALTSFSESARLWSEIGAPYQMALARLGLARAHRAAGRQQEATFERRAANAILDGLAGRRTGDPAQGERAAGSDATEAEAPETSGVFRREGDYWSVQFEGRTVRIRDLKGMRYLAHLLAEPGREFHVLDLVAAEGGRPQDGSGRVVNPSGTSLGDAGVMLDDKAKSAYRRRLAEIEADLEEARSLGDTARTAQAKAEHDFLVRELSRAYGLGGRRRRAGSASERARAAVTRAVRTAMTRIREHHPSLAEHLGRAIRTGTYCAYQPDPRLPLRWDTSGTAHS